MADLRRTRTGTSTRTRSRSRPSRPGSPNLHRLLSSQFPDDHSVYHHEAGEGVHVDNDAASLHQTETERRRAELSSDDSDTTSAVSEKEVEVSDEQQETTVEEIKGGIPFEHDVEASEKKSENQKADSSPLAKDRNLVTWESANDPKNPK